MPLSKVRQLLRHSFQPPCPTPSSFPQHRNVPLHRCRNLPRSAQSLPGPNQSKSNPRRPCIRPLSIHKSFEQPSTFPLESMPRRNHRCHRSLRGTGDLVRTPRPQTDALPLPLLPADAPLPYRRCAKQLQRRRQIPDKYQVSNENIHREHQSLFRVNSYAPGKAPSVVKRLV